MLLLSDTHFEWDKKLLDYNNVISKKTDDNVVILAGDIAGGRYIHEFVEHLTNLGYIVLYIPGNHEYYGFSISEMDKRLADYFDTKNNAYFMNNRSMVIDDVRFIGSTLWAAADTININPITGDFQRATDVDYFVRSAIKRISDFRQIIDFSIDSMVDLFWENLTFLQNELNKPFHGKTVVFTHHAPSPECVHASYKNQINGNHAYYSNLDSFIKKNFIDFWLHGHMHHSNDFYIDNTHILSNPRGYHDLHSLNLDFNWFKSINVNNSL
jgi:Icc-related predicted phosphoesterase